QVSLIPVIDAFLRKGFSFAEAHNLVGPAGEKTEHAIIVTPRPGSNVEWAALEQFRTEPDAPPFLLGICLRFKSPVAVDFAELRQRFGREWPVTRSGRGDDAHYLFRLKGEDYDGNLILDVPHESSSSKRMVRAQSLDRFPSKRVQGKDSFGDVTPWPI